MSDIETSTEAGYELRDTKPTSLVLWGVVLLLVVVLAVFASWAFFDQLAASAARRDVPPSPFVSNAPPPEPRLLVNEPADLKAVLGEEEEVLDSYGWVDKSRGIVRIPIERAMELVAKEGLPSRETEGASR
jgi:hypothetical protein